LLERVQEEPAAIARGGKPPRWQLRYIRRLPLFSPRLWLRRFVYWIGALLVALMAIAFASGADAGQAVFRAAMSFNRASVFVLAPAGLALSVVLTRRFFPGAQGSGIPQVIAALHMTDSGAIRRILSWRVAFGKVLLTLLGLACGASIGREGPTVQVGATIMYGLGRSLRLPRVQMERALVLAGGAAGIAGAFNTPLAGIVFAIEELSHSFEARTSGTVLTAVIVAGIATLALVGNYTYFGVTSVQLDFGAGWVAVAMCSVAGGLAGGLFSRWLIAGAASLPRAAGLFVMRHPVWFAAFCGLAIAVLGWLSDGNTYGTGYDQAKLLVEGRAQLPVAFAIYKFAATVVSYLSGIPGGIFAPSLAVGAGLGDLLAPLLPSAPSGAVVLLGMVAYFSGVVQAPITATVIVMEMTNNQNMTIPLMTTSMLAFGISRLVCRRALYGALARRYLLVMGH
jgi:H+/Cl- antiporter ClcA